MTRRYMRYLFWRGGRLPGYEPGYADATFWLEEGMPSVGQVTIDVDHHVVHHKR